MPCSAKDIRLTEFKDTISKLNELIMTQTRSMDSLQKTIEDLRQELSNRQAEVDYLKAKLFGSSSEKLKAPFPGQMSLFEEMPDERIPEIIEPEIIDVDAHKRERKPKATYEELFENLPRRQVPLDTLTEEEKNCPVCGTQMVHWNTFLRPDQTKTCLMRNLTAWHLGVRQFINAVSINHRALKVKIRGPPGFFKREYLITLRLTLGKAGADEIDLLLPKYRKEQGELKGQLALFQEESNEQKETAQNAEKWVALIRQYSDLQELTAGIIRELITKIYVGDFRKVDGEKVQSIEIHYRFIGSLSDGARK